MSCILTASAAIDYSMDGLLAGVLRGAADEQHAPRIAHRRLTAHARRSVPPAGTPRSRRDCAQIALRSRRDAALRSVPPAMPPQHSHPSRIEPATLHRRQSARAHHATSAGALRSSRPRDAFSGEGGEEWREMKEKLDGLKSAMSTASISVRSRRDLGASSARISARISARSRRCATWSCARSSRRRRARTSRARSGAMRRINCAPSTAPRRAARGPQGGDRCLRRTLDGRGRSRRGRASRRHDRRALLYATTCSRPTATTCLIWQVSANAPFLEATKATRLRRTQKFPGHDVRPAGQVRYPRGPQVPISAMISAIISGL